MSTRKTYAITALLLLCSIAPELDAQRRSRRKRKAPVQKAAPKTLEFRAMVYHGDSYGSETFDLVAEAKRLTDWIDSRDNRDRLLRNPGKVEMFGWLRPDEGGPISPWLRWYPRVISESRRRPGRYDFALSNVHGKVIVVPLFDHDEYRAGPRTMTPRLVEFVPVSSYAPYFDQNDFDPQSLTIIPPKRIGESQFYVRYAIKPERLEDLLTWTEAHKLQVAPIIQNGFIVRAEVIRTSRQAQGLLLAGHTLKSAQTLVEDLRRAIKADTRPNESLALRRKPSSVHNVRLYAEQLSDHAESSVRLLAARRLQWFGREAGPATRQLMDAVRDQDVRVALAAIDALASMGSEAMSAVPMLTKLRNASHRVIQEHAKAALIRIRFNGKKSWR